MGNTKSQKQTPCTFHRVFFHSQTSANEPPSQSIRGRRSAMVEVPKVPQAPQRVRRRRRLARNVPLTQRRRARHLGAHLGAGCHGDAARRRRVRLFAVAVVVRRRPPRAAVHLHVLPEGRGVGV